MTTENTTPATEAPAELTADQIAENEAAAQKLADAQAALAAAEAKLAPATEAVKAQTEANKTARKNGSDAKKYMKGLGERTEENAADFDAGTESQSGWESALEAGVKTLAENREAVKTVRREIKDAKALVKSLTPGKANRSSGKPRVSMDPATVIQAVELGEGVKAPSGMMGDVVTAFATATTYEAGTAALKVVVEAKGEAVTSKQRWDSLDAYVAGYIKGAIRANLVAVVPAA